MAIINSRLLCCCGPSAPIVLKAGANMSAVYWAFTLLRSQLEGQQLVCVVQWSMSVVLSKP